MTTLCCGISCMNQHVKLKVETRSIFEEIVESLKLSIGDSHQWITCNLTRQHPYRMIDINSLVTAFHVNESCSCQRDRIVTDTISLFSSYSWTTFLFHSLPLFSNWNCCGQVFYHFSYLINSQALQKLAFFDNCYAMIHHSYAYYIFFFSDTQKFFNCMHNKLKIFMV